MIVYDCERCVVEAEGGRLVGREKRHSVLKDDNTVLVQRFGDDLGKSFLEAFERIGAKSIIEGSTRIGIKINLGGGIHYVPATYSDPVIGEAIIQAVKKMGGKPFVCEADMRAHLMDEKMLRIRGYWDLLRREEVAFVNLSRGKTVEVHCEDVDVPLKLPEILLRPDVGIISFAPPKHHWECGITCNQKNMYGAIAEFRKSIYHRRYGRIDHVVAAASRMMRPDLNILATFELGGGLGPHFSIPVAFNRMIVSKDMIYGDKAASEILAYPFGQVVYAMINTEGKDVAYRLHPDSDWPDAVTLDAIRRHALNWRQVKRWKAFLYPQYFVPHGVQIRVYPPFEFLLTWINRYVFEKLS